MKSGYEHDKLIALARLGCARLVRDNAHIHQVCYISRETRMRFLKIQKAPDAERSSKNPRTMPDVDIVEKENSRKESKFKKNERKDQSLSSATSSLCFFDFFFFFSETSSSPSSSLCFLFFFSFFSFFSSPGSSGAM